MANVVPYHGWRLSDEKIAGSYNNFYEFSMEKDQVRLLTGKFETAPCPIEIKGLVDKPLTIDAQERKLCRRTPRPETA